MKRLLILALLLACSAAQASIARTSFCAAATTTCTLANGTPGNGDLEIDIAFRTTTTAPTLPAGYTTILTASASGNSFRAGCKINAGSTTIGTWTNATSIVAVTYSGTAASSSAGCLAGIGASTNSTAAASTTMSYGTITLAVGNGTSWVIGAGADNTVATCNPSTMTNVTSVGSGPEATLNDTNAGVSSWATATCTVTSSTWRTVVIELIQKQVINSGACNNAGGATTVSCTITATGSGHALWLAADAETEPETFTFSDGASDSATTIVTQNCAPCTSAVAIGYIKSASSGVTTVTATLSTSAGATLHYYEVPCGTGGCGAADGAGLGANNAANGTFAVGPYTTSHTDNLLSISTCPSAGSAGTWTIATPFLFGVTEFDSTAGISDLSAYMVNTASGAYTSTATYSSSCQGAQVIAAAQYSAGSAGTVRHRAWVINQ